MGTINLEIEEEALFNAIEDANAKHHELYRSVLFSVDAINKIVELICDEERDEHGFKELNFNNGEWMYSNEDETDFLKKMYRTGESNYHSMYIAVNNNGEVITCLRSMECTSMDAYNDNVKWSYNDSNVASIIKLDRYEVPGYPNGTTIFLRILYNENYAQNKKNREAAMQVIEVAENMMKKEKFDLKDANEKRAMSATKYNLQASAKIELPKCAIPTVEENLKKTFEYLTKLMSGDNDKYDFEELSRKSIDDIIDTINNAGLKLIHRIAFVGLIYDITKLFSNENIIAYGFSGYDSNANPLLRIEEITRDRLRYAIDTKEFIKATIECIEDKANQWYVVYVLYTDIDGTVTLTFTIY